MFGGKGGARPAPEAMAKVASPESYTPRHVAEKIPTSRRLVSILAPPEIH
jgi:hypothetical protein